jgi:hypothetical protein
MTGLRTTCVERLRWQTRKRITYRAYPALFARDNTRAIAMAWFGLHRTRKAHSERDGRFTWKGTTFKLIECPNGQIVHAPRHPVMIVGRHRLRAVSLPSWYCMRAVRF